MKKIQSLLITLLMTTSILTSAQTGTTNPFGLVYQNAIIKNIPGKVNIHPVTYQLNGITIAVNIYTPAGYDTNKKYPAIVVAHPNSTFLYTMSSLLNLMTWDAATYMELINQPLLMIAGSQADTKYMTDEAFAKATGTQNKELYLLDGATHIQTYWKEEYVKQAINKLTEFFNKNIH